MGPLLPESSNRGKMRSIEVLGEEIWGRWVLYGVIGCPYRFHDMANLVYSPYQPTGLVGVNNHRVRTPHPVCKWQFILPVAV